MAWFDLPIFLAMLIATALINCTTPALGMVIKDVTGVTLLPADSAWRAPPRPLNVRP
jgi:hypothetical protein